MARNIGLTRREEELMDFLWEYDQPITSNNILESYDTSYWSESYLYVMLRPLFMLFDDQPSYSAPSRTALRLKSSISAFRAGTHF